MNRLLLVVALIMAGIKVQAQSISLLKEIYPHNARPADGTAAGTNRLSSLGGNTSGDLNGKSSLEVFNNKLYFDAYSYLGSSDGIAMNRLLNTGVATAFIISLRIRISVLYVR